METATVIACWFWTILLTALSYFFLPAQTPRWACWLVPTIVAILCLGLGGCILNAEEEKKDKRDAEREREERQARLELQKHRETLAHRPRCKVRRSKAASDTDERADNPFFARFRKGQGGIKEP